MFEFSKIASAFLTESKLDLRSAKLLFENGIYSRAIYFAHQSSEKAIKSCLAIRNIISGEHKVTVFFEKEFNIHFFHVQINLFGFHLENMLKMMQEKQSKKLILY